MWIAPAKLQSSSLEDYTAGRLSRLLVLASSLQLQVPSTF